HPVIQDGQGRRMSKSLGNGIDPVDIIEMYGADTLRFGLASAATETQDLRLPIEKIKLDDGREVNTSDRFEQAKPFANKLWNAARFVMSNLGDYTGEPVKPKQLTIEDRWILATLRSTVEQANSSLEKFQFEKLAKTLRDFTWNDFCDWAIEFAKPRLKDASQKPVAQAVVVEVLDTLVRLLHPIVPFVTEQIWQSLATVAPGRGLFTTRSSAESICIAPWPKPEDLPADDLAQSRVDLWKDGISAIRNIRAERNLPKDARPVPVMRVAATDVESLAAGLTMFQTMAGIGDWRVVDVVEALPADIEQARARGELAAKVLDRVEILIPLGQFIDKDAERVKLRKSMADLEKQIGGIEAKLGNASFVERAPADLVGQQRQKLEELQARRGALLELLAALEQS
ncbi:MAG: class I tRNA ligase family protein, partial [bacterium]